MRTKSLDSPRAVGTRWERSCVKRVLIAFSISRTRVWLGLAAVWKAISAHEVEVLVTIAVVIEN